MNSLFPTTESSAWMASLGPIALKGAALLALALLAGASLHKASAARRYVLWLSSLLALGLLTIAVPMLPAWRVLPTRDGPTFEMPGSEEREEAAAVEEEPLPLSTNTVPLTPVARPEAATSTESSAPFHLPAVSWSDVVAHLPMAWLVITSVLIARLIVSSMRLSRLRRRCSKVEVPFRLNAMLGELSGISGKAAPTLLIGPADSIPMVWGIVQPCLLLPADAAEWPEEKIRSVLLHELAHLQRRDPAALLVAQIAQALHWFNPLAWLTLRSLRADQEKACDDAVLRQGVRASAYAQHLLDLSRHRRLSLGLGPCALAMARSAPVENRIEAILDSRIKRDASSRRAALSTAFCSAAIAVPLAMMANEAAKGLRGRILDRHGVVLAESTKEKVRQYPLKALGASVLGYVGKSESNDPNHEGREGIEKAHNDTLRKGEDVKLSLDARIQALSVRVMQEAGVGRGAVVVLDPRDGDVLAAASLPSFDPNHFIPAISLESWDRYIKDKTLPLLDRCLRGKFAPGSALMPLTALGGVSAGICNEKFNCTGSFTYGSKDMKCWISTQGRSHGALDLEHALQTSCNCFWYQFGNKAGSAALEGVAKRVGFGEPTGVLDGESAGVFPVESWFKKNRPDDRWTPAAMANLSIGQGFTQVTPMQMAMLAATIANSGHVPSPRLVDADAPAQWRADLVKDGSDPKDIERIREGMRLVVNEDGGSGGRARSAVTQIAGKTGTAQYFRMIDGKQTKDNHCWFIGFAPYDRPTLAFAVLVQGGKSGGDVCAPIAKRIVEETLALPTDGSGKVEPVEEQAGHFKPIESKETEEVRKAEPSSPSQKATKPDMVKNMDAQLHAYLQQTKDSLYPFLEKYQDKPSSFQVRIRRMHYFKDDVPDLDEKDCFEIQPMTVPPGQGYVGMVFVPKSSRLAARLMKILAWESRGEEADVTLKWSEEQGKKWVEMMEVRDIKHPIPPGKDAKPDKEEQTPGDEPDLRRKAADAAKGETRQGSKASAARSLDDSLRDSGKVTGNSTPTQMPSDQIFGEGSDHFNDRAKLTLMKLGFLIEKNPGTQFVITCYTDSVGDDQANLELSQRRADAVATWLNENLHLSTQRIKAVGMGEKDLIETKAGADKEARRVNQRLEIKVRPIQIDPKPGAQAPGMSSNAPDDSTERRLRLIQSECGLSDLPPDVTKLQSDLAGGISPREVVVRFSGPREAVRLWLAGCSGLRAPAAEAKPVDPSLRILEANPLAVMDQWLKRPAIALSDWPSSGSTGRFECMGKSAMCSITVHAPDDDVVNVELRKQARSIKL